MHVGDRIELDDLSGEVIAVDEVSDTYTVRWETGAPGGYELTYMNSVKWEGNP